MTKQDRIRQISHAAELSRIIAQLRRELASLESLKESIVKNEKASTGAGEQL